MTEKTLRDEFAMAALTGLCAHGLGGGAGEISDAAEDAYHLADAMMQARAECKEGAA